MRHSVKQCVVTLGLAAVLFWPSLGVLAEELTADDIINSLTPTEDAGGNALNSAHPPSLDSSGPPSVGPGSQSSLRPSAPTTRPSVNLEVTFETNSARLTSEGMRQLGKLGAALTSPKLAESRFLIVGHTDARGSVRHNISLSKKRAQTVRKFLVSSFDIVGSRLAAQGVGSAQPKNETDPDAGENRRVEIVNVSE